MKRQIKLLFSVEPVEHDDSVGESEVRNLLPSFFRTPHGKRETYSFYRGFIIVRNTRQYTGCRPERYTQVYIIIPADRNVFHVGFDGNTVKSAQRMIDRILNIGRLDGGAGIENELTNDGEAFVSGQIIKAACQGGYTVTGHDWYGTVNRAINAAIEEAQAKASGAVSLTI